MMVFMCITLKELRGLVEWSKEIEDVKEQTSEQPDVFSSRE